MFCVATRAEPQSATCRCTRKSDTDTPVLANSVPWSTRSATRFIPCPGRGVVEYAFVRAVKKQRTAQNRERETADDKAFTDRASTATLTRQLTIMLRRQYPRRRNGARRSPNQRVTLHLFIRRRYQRITGSANSNPPIGR